MPEELRKEIETKKLPYIRIWGITLTIFTMLFQVSQMTKTEDVSSPNTFEIIIRWIATAILVLLTIYSYKKNIKCVYILIFVCQVRLFMGVW